MKEIIKMDRDLWATSLLKLANTLKNQCFKFLGNYKIALANHATFKNPKKPQKNDN